MDITLERVERLREKADVTYAQAKEALEYSRGDLLDALIYLEEQGTIPRMEEAYYSTRGETPAAQEESLNDDPEQEQAEGSAPMKESFGKKLRFWLLDNELEIWRKDRPVTAMPVLVLILLLVVAAWAMVPLIIIGMLCGFRYRLSGPDTERDREDGGPGRRGDTASDVGRQVMNELRSQHDDPAQEQNKKTSEQNRTRETEQADEE